MISLVLGSLIALLGVPLLIRGWIFSLKPDHPWTRQTLERNLRLGLEADMVRWGRRVRRVGLFFLLTGATLVAFGINSFAP